MVCQNCHAEVDNDLIFCTNCGARLSAVDDQPATVFINESIVTKPSNSVPPAKSGSSLKWLALIAAILAVPASLLIAYLLLSNAKTPPVTEKSNVNSLSPVNRRANSNSPSKTPIETNANVNVSISNVNPSNVAANFDDGNSAQPDSDKSEIEIVDDRIEITPGEHIAYPFKLDADAQIIGEAKVLQGAEIEGYVYLQNVYDEYFPDPTYKISGTAGKKLEWDQLLVAGDYVLVFINKTQKPVVLQAKFHTEK